MGVGTKKIANSVASADDNSFGGRMKSLPERIKAFYNDVRTEMRKVTAPSFKEVRATTLVVIVTVFFFGVFFAVLDPIISRAYDLVLRAFTK
jgi:preprotein translocase subunit SecE